jgi:integrase
MKFTKAAVIALKRPANKADHVEWDDDLPGFGVRMRGDSKTWLVQYRVGLRQRRESLGDLRKVALEDARKAARQRFARAHLGVDPVAEKAKARTAAAAAALTVGSVADKYLTVKEATHRPNTHTAARRYLMKYWRPLRDRPLDSVKRADVAALLHDLTKAHGRVAASRARSTLSATFAWAAREGLVDLNPVTATNIPDAGIKARERVLSLAELAMVWRACRNDSFGRIVKLLMLVGARRNEVGGLRWSEVDLEASTVTIPGERVKNGRTLMLPLAPAAIDILRSAPRLEGRPYVFGRTGEGFGSWSSVMTDLRHRIIASGEKLSAFSLHDLRRSAATGMAELGVAPHIVEQILNHQSGSKKGIAGIYNRATYAAEVRSALARWAEALLAAVENRESKVTPLRRA